jgi:anti-sigma factor RsiW
VEKGRSFPKGTKALESHNTIILAAVDGTLERDRDAALNRLLAAAERRDAVSQVLRDADHELAEAVHEARELGIPWDAIAAPVGMTRQAVAKRFTAL